MTAKKVLHKHYKGFEERIAFPEQVIAAMEEYAEIRIKQITEDFLKEIDSLQQVINDLSKEGITN